MTTRVESVANRLKASGYEVQTFLGNRLSIVCPRDDRHNFIVGDLKNDTLIMACSKTCIRPDVLRILGFPDEAERVRSVEYETEVERQLLLLRTRKVAQQRFRDEEADPEDPTSDSWAPVDLGPYLRGEVEHPEPTLGAVREDGLRFIYPGLEHAVIGEMESGKSWFCLAMVAAVLLEREPVLYLHFEEADAGGSVERLVALGVPAPIIQEYLSFVGPARPVTPDALDRLLTRGPRLVVLDGVNEAMSLHGWDMLAVDGAASFRRNLVKPCTAIGAATLAADHVTKDKDGRGRNAIGSVHKGNGLTGALFLLENVEPFGRGMKGRSNLFIGKDRPGHLRRNGEPTKLPGKTYVGTMAVDDTRLWVSYLDLKIWPPTDKRQVTDDSQADRSQDDHVFGAVVAVIASGQTATTRKIRAMAGGNAVEVGLSLDRLVLAGRLTETPGPRNAIIYAPATGSEDHLAETGS